MSIDVVGNSPASIFHTLLYLCKLIGEAIKPLHMWLDRWLFLEKADMVKLETS